MSVVKSVVKAYKRHIDYHMVTNQLLELSLIANDARLGRIYAKAREHLGTLIVKRSRLLCLYTRKGRFKKMIMLVLVQLPASQLQLLTDIQKLVMETQCRKILTKRCSSISGVSTPHITDRLLLQRAAEKASAGDNRIRKSNATLEVQTDNQPLFRLLGKGVWYRNPPVLEVRSARGTERDFEGRTTVIIIGLGSIQPYLPH
ncbi:hypothetical protein DFH29DRAFT_870769 [Suillus ampliporus]|nr:hypothetical protein DFH29DRAFT_870769 [Suillus ampliporus]